MTVTEFLLARIAEDATVQKYVEEIITKALEDMGNATT